MVYRPILKAPESAFKRWPIQWNISIFEIPANGHVGPHSPARTVAHPTRRAANASPGRGGRCYRERMIFSSCQVMMPRSRGC